MIHAVDTLLPIGLERKSEFVSRASLLSSSPASYLEARQHCDGIASTYTVLRRLCQESMASHRSIWKATVVILLLFLVVGQFRESPVIDPSTLKFEVSTPNFSAPNGSGALHFLNSNSTSASDAPSIANLNSYLVSNSTLADASSSSLESNFSASNGFLSTLQWKFPVANFTAINAKRAIFLLSMGQEAAESTIVERCLLSIRRRGAYLGPVIVLTDAPLERYESLTSVDPNLVVLHPRSEDWRWDLRDDMPYKRFKTYILEYLDLDDRLKFVELVYYLDVDIVVGRELQRWFDHVESTYLPANQAYSSSMSFFQGDFKNWRPIQGGQFVLERNSSQACLERWRYHIDAHPDEAKDQYALALMWKKQKNGTPSSRICHLTKMPQHTHLKFLATKSMEELVESQQYPTMMHIKNTQFADKIPSEIQSRFFGQLLMLSPTESQFIGKTRIRPSQSQLGGSSDAKVKNATND
jgi:hypothetical protein